MVKEKERKVPVQAFVSRQFTKMVDGESQEGKLEGTDEIIQVNKFVTEPAKVTVEYGLTINLGNFESAKVGVAVTVPCYFEELDDAYKWATRWAEERVGKEKDNIQQSLNRQEAF